jgi:hypothetical protein
MLCNIVLRLNPWVCVPKACFDQGKECHIQPPETGPNSGKHVFSRLRIRGAVFLFSHKLLPPNLMSRTHGSASSSSNFHSIINSALRSYEKRTKKNLLSHPLAEQLQTCNSPGAILLILQQQVREINQSQSGDEMLTKWLDPTVNVLYSFTEALGEGFGLVWFKTCFPLRSAHSCLFVCRFSHLRKRYL